MKIEADIVDEVQFPSTSREELINVKKEMTEAAPFVGVKAEAENEVRCNYIVKNILSSTLIELLVAHTNTEGVNETKTNLAYCKNAVTLLECEHRCGSIL